MTRTEARNLGLVHFNGKPCNRCAGTLRYVSNNRCVPCLRVGDVSMDEIQARARHHEALRDAARAAGQRRYQGQDCPLGHGAERSTKTGACIQCRRLIEAKHARREKARVNLEHANEFQPNPIAINENLEIPFIQPPTKAMLMGRRAP